MSLGGFAGMGGGGYNAAKFGAQSTANVFRGKVPGRAHFVPITDDDDPESEWMRNTVAVEFDEAAPRR